MIRRTLLSCFAVLVALPAWAIDIQQVTSPGGIRAWLVQDNSIPFVALDLQFDGGASLDIPGQWGAINLMMGLLEEGAGPYGAQEFAEETERLAARFSFDTNRDSIGIQAEMLTSNRGEAVALLREAIIAPLFDPTAIERVRGQVLANIAADAQDPSELAVSAFNAAAFGDHPYAQPIAGTTDTITALTRDDLVLAHSNVLARDRVYVGAAGDINAEELGLLLDTLLGDLPANGATLPGPAPYLLQGGTTVVEFPTPQSVAIFGHEGLERLDEDFFAAFVLNQILGGGNFRSRLMEQVRVERGLTYGVYSYLATREHRPMWLGQFSSSNSLVAEAIDVIRDIWVDISENGVTEAEIEAAKLYLTGAYPLRFDGNVTIAGILTGMQIDEMPVDYITTRNDQVNAVTQDDVLRVAQRLLRPENLHFTVVGQPEGLMTGN
jgi:zinc protease